MNKQTRDELDRMLNHVMPDWPNDWHIRSNLQLILQNQLDPAHAYLAGVEIGAKLVLMRMANRVHPGSLR
jgi:hypothetical protein